MSRSALSIFVFGLYLMVLGIFLMAIPNLLLTMVNIPPTQEVWIQLVGMLLIILGFFYIQVARADFTRFFRWTLVTRMLAFIPVIYLVLFKAASPAFLVFWLGDLAGATWTFLALRSEGRLYSNE